MEIPADAEIEPTKENLPPPQLPMDQSPEKG